MDLEDGDAQHAVQAAVAVHEARVDAPQLLPAVLRLHRLVLQLTLRQLAQVRVREVEPVVVRSLAHRVAHAHDQHLRSVLYTRVRAGVVWGPCANCLALSNLFSTTHFTLRSVRDLTTDIKKSTHAAQSPQEPVPMHIVVVKNCMPSLGINVRICVTLACNLLCVRKSGKSTIGVTGESWGGRRRGGGVGRSILLQGKML